MEKLVEGVVIETNGEMAKVRCSIHSDCEHCGVCPGSNAMIIDVLDQVGVEKGQRVEVDSNQSNMLLAAFVIFMLPMLAVGSGILLGYYLSIRLMISPVLLMTLGGLTFGLSSIYIIKRVDRSMQSNKPIIVKQLNN